jgi:hypothetical protein
VHKAILEAFANTGHAPGAVALAAASPDGHGPVQLLNELHHHDVIRLDDHGEIAAAYPFSAVRTPHAVSIEDGPMVWAMCGLDALGISAMLHRSTTITSADPTTGAGIRIEIHDGHAEWIPGTAVLFVGSETTTVSSSDPDCCPLVGGAEYAAAADRCCGVINFFTSLASANTWIVSHADVSGMVLTQEQALRLGADIFGRLLHDLPAPTRAACGSG